jgi:penicillin-binding protein 2
MTRSVQRINKMDEAELHLLKKRIDIATAVIILLGAMLFVRLWYLQIHKGNEFSKLAESNRVRIQDIAAPRGNILDRKGRLLVTNRPSFNVVWVKEDAPNPDQVIKQLSEILDEDINILLNKIRNAAGRPRYLPLRLQEDIDWKKLVYIENHRYELPGVRIEVLPSRDYLFGDMASHIIGYLGEINQEELDKLADQNYRGGDLVGKMGIEKLYESHLKGEKGRNYLEVDVHGLEQKQLTGQEPMQGNDLILTLDLDLQFAAEQAMTGKAGTVIAMEVNTGRLLVLASSPPLELQKFIGGISTTHWKEMLEDPLHPLINKTVQGQYPPASTYKIITAIAALAERLVTPETVVYCSGGMQFGNRRYGCWKKGGHGPVDLKRALAESCDVYFYQAGLKLGVDTLAKYAMSFGLGKRTGIEIEHEKAGLIPTAAWKLNRHKIPWQDGETLSIAIGQGFNLTTPLQVCQMTAVIANGGILYRPQFIESIVDHDGQARTMFTPMIDGKALGDEKTFSLVRNGMIAAVNGPSATGGRSRLPDIVVAGKTGTAQVVHMEKFTSMGKDIPYKYRDHGWFTAFAPADKPEIAVTVLVEHGGGGGANAAPIAKVVLERYFEIRQDAGKQTQEGVGEYGAF